MEERNHEFLNDYIKNCKKQGEMANIKFLENLHFYFKLINTKYNILRYDKRAVIYAVFYICVISRRPIFGSLSIRELLN